MGHRIISQNRGRGGPNYRVPSHRYKACLKHRKHAPDETVKGKVVAIEHDPARSAPIAKLRFEDGEQLYAVVPEGVAVGDTMEYGIKAEIKAGSTLPLSAIPEGLPVCNVESRPGDGGKFIRASGTYGIVVAQEPSRTNVQMPSGKIRWFNPRCRATIGVVAGGGRPDKPLVKAGKAHHKMRNAATNWPRVRGVAMNVIDHPFGGGGRQHPSRPKSVARGTPHGRKVGSIASRRTGRR
ncbi:MAG: 50S ribosomal protein L2 [Methermicoccaceae archaeon]